MCGRFTLTNDNVQFVTDSAVGRCTRITGRRYSRSPVICGGFKWRTTNSNTLKLSSGLRSLPFASPGYSRCGSGDSDGSSRRQVGVW